MRMLMSMKRPGSAGSSLIGPELRRPLRLLGAALGVAALLAASTVAAQEPAFNTVEIGNWDEPGQDFADVWGEGNFAYIAHNGQRVVTIVDITDPANPVFASRYDADRKSVV